MTTHSSSAHILVIDDNPADVELIELGFEANDVSVRIDQAGDGIEAQEKLRALADAGDCPQLILLDLNMPRANGFEVLQFIHRLELCAHTVTVVMTTSNAVSDRERCLAMGVKQFMTKPPRFDDLLAMLKRLEVYLDHGQASDER
jgi:CheY-like chemotaxis protein